MHTRQTYAHTYVCTHPQIHRSIRTLVYTRPGEHSYVHVSMGTRVCRSPAAGGGGPGERSHGEPACFQENKTAPFTPLQPKVPARVPAPPQCPEIAASAQLVTVTVVLCR